MWSWDWWCMLVYLEWVMMRLVADGNDSLFRIYIHFNFILFLYDYQRIQETNYRISLPRNLFLHGCPSGQRKSMSGNRNPVGQVHDYQSITVKWKRENFSCYFWIRISMLWSFFSFSFAWAYIQKVIHYLEQVRFILLPTFHFQNVIFSRIFQW